MDSYNVAYDQISSGYTDAASEEDAEEETTKDTIIIASIKKLSDLERQVANNTEMVECSYLVAATQALHRS